MTWARPRHCNGKPRFSLHVLAAAVLTRDALGRVELVDGGASYQGRLEVWIHGTRGTVCDDDFGDVEARVACKELGYDDGIFRGFDFGAGSGEIVMDDVHCRGGESHLEHCSFNPSPDCTHYEDVSVECRSSSHGDLRLGESKVVEVFYQGSWGTICSSGFSQASANVSCHELGLGDAVSRSSASRSGRLNVILDSVSCFGDEIRLMDCPHAPGHWSTCSEGLATVQCSRHAVDEIIAAIPGILGAVVGVVISALCCCFVVVVCLMRQKRGSQAAAAGPPPGALLAGAPPPMPMTLGALSGVGGGASGELVERKGKVRINVKVPRNGRPGQQIKMKTPHGVTIMCTIPPGFVPGMIFQAEYIIPDDHVQLIDEDGLFCSALAIPKYWTNARPPELEDEDDDDDGDSTHVKVAKAMPAFDQMVYVGPEQNAVFDKLLDKSYVAKSTQDRPCPTGSCPKTQGGCPCVRPGGNPGLPKEYRVRRVVRVEDSEMWTRYEVKRDELRAKMMGTMFATGDHFRALDPPAVTDEIADKYEDIFEPLDGSLNEVYLWHGTAVRTALSIAQEDFRIDLAGTGAGTMYGPGAYMAESSTKADEYARDEKGGHYDGVFALLLCRVCLGKFYYTTERDDSAGRKVLAGAFDSTVGDRIKSANTFREFVVYNADQVYPEYIVLYSRVHARDTRQKISAMLHLELHMELPVYWANCHKDPNKEGFHQQYKVRPRTLAILQRLVHASYTGGLEVKIISARRVENSTIWNSYMDFKRNTQLTARRQRSSGSFRPDELLENDVLTMRHLQHESMEECISVSNVELALNELMLWHGTDKASGESIVRNDFIIPRGGQAKHGGRYGTGAYFAEDMAKSLQYAVEENRTKTVLLCRVCCGDIYFTESAFEQDAVANAVAMGKHSVVANPAKASRSLEDKFKAREFIVPDARQVYPEYILELRENVPGVRTTYTSNPD